MAKQRNGKSQRKPDTDPLDGTETDEARHEQEFKERVLDPTGWIELADDLMEAAELLGPKVDEFWKTRVAPSPKKARLWDDEFVAMHFMFMTFALENLVKAHIVVRHRYQMEKALEEKLVLPEKLKNHDLYALFHYAGLCGLANDEEQLLAKLSRSAIWYGRYPVPMTPRALARDRKSASSDERFRLTDYSGWDRRWIQRIFRELRHNRTIIDLDRAGPDV